jgi:hypothetical protein
MADLTVRQLVVLQIVVDHGPLSTRAVMDHVRDRCPCPGCEQSGFPTHVPEDTCRLCYGWGHVPFTMSDAYRTLTQLWAKERVRREEQASGPLMWLPTTRTMLKVLRDRSEAYGLQA